MAKEKIFLPFIVFSNWCNHTTRMVQIHRPPEWEERDAHSPRWQRLWLLLLSLKKKKKNLLCILSVHFQAVLRNFVHLFSSQRQHTSEISMASSRHSPVSWQDSKRLQSMSQSQLQSLLAWSSLEVWQYLLDGQQVSVSQCSQVSGSIIRKSQNWQNKQARISVAHSSKKKEKQRDIRKRACLITQVWASVTTQK